jgi:DnaK suppressor protein
MEVRATTIGGFGRALGPGHRDTLMDKKRLDYYKKKLQTRREELLRDIARNQQEGREADEDPTVDLADKAANSYTKEFLFGQTHSDRALLQLVDDALVRIKDGSFGECISCHEELQQKRLEAVPWTRYCISCQEKKEKGLL